MRLAWTGKIDASAIHEAEGSRLGKNPAAIAAKENLAQAALCRQAAENAIFNSRTAAKEELKDEFFFIAGAEELLHARLRAGNDFRRREGHLLESFRKLVVGPVVLDFCALIENNRSISQALLLPSVR